MNITDLNDILNEHADSAAARAPTMDARLSGALGKARAIRQRRLAAAGVAVVAVLAMASAVVVPRMLTTDPEPATPPDMTLDSYAHGGELIADTSINLPRTSTEVTVTPEALPMTFEARCDPPVRLSLTFDGGKVLEAPCGGEMQWLGDWEEGMPGDEPSIPLGVPITFTLTVEGGYHEPADATTEVPDSGRVVLGIYESVPRTEYGFPPPPDELIDLDGPGTAQEGPGRHIVTAADDPNEKVTVEFEGDNFEMEVRSQTPGVLRVRLNGRELGVAEFWDYSGKKVVPLSSTTLTKDRRDFKPLPEGRNVVEFIPEDFTGEWRALLTACAIESDGNEVCPAGSADLAETPFTEVVRP